MGEEGFLRKGLRFAALLLALAALLCGCAPRAEDGSQRTLVASFYPIYVFCENVCAGVEGVKVVSMAGPEVGCLHDYQLRAGDMALLEDAWALAANGGGMERFLDKALAARPDLPVIDASEGIELIASAHEHEHGHEHEHEGEDGEEPNAHVWLDPALAMRQVENIARGLSALDPENAALYEKNAAEYNARLAALDAELKETLAPVAGREIVTFHEAFEYFARAYGLRVAGVVEHEPGENPGTRELAETCDLVESLGLTALFVEPQYPQNAAETVARETGARVYTLDPGVSGDGAADSYERCMRENARVLLEALL